MTRLRLCQHGNCCKTGTKQPCMTQIHYEDGEENPNKNPVLCDDHAEEYREFWQEQWNNLR